MSPSSSGTASASRSTWGLRIPEDADRIGALYETQRNIIQPSEFLLGPDRRVLHATYSSGPIGRIAADDVVKLVGFLAARAQARGCGPWRDLAASRKEIA